MSAIEQIGREFAISERVQQQVVLDVEPRIPMLIPIRAWLRMSGSYH